MSKIMVAMSGGVDSTVTAYLLKKAGHEIIGCYMQLFEDPKLHEENIRKVKKVASYLNIEYKVLDLKDKFNEFVYFPFIKTYEEGKTPNPCVLCNRYIKTGALVDYALKEGMEKLATGHYARIIDGLITEAYDLSKDQSYFLSNIKKEALKNVVFPLGEMNKEDVKAFASTIDVLKEFATQKESSEICFVKDTYVDILKEHMDVNKPGDVVDVKGNIIGKHQGYMHYTIGKRRGFEIKGAHEPHYVIKIDPVRNQIIVGTKEDLEIQEFSVKDLNMFIDEKSFNCEVKIRYRSPKSPCFVSIDENMAKITLKENVQGLASGQMAVFYKGNQIIGSGCIVS